MRRSPVVRIALVAFAAALFACGAALSSRTPARSPLATEWFDRAKKSYQAADFDDARDSAARAITAAPGDPEARVLAAHVALVRLDYAEVLRLTEGLTSSEAHGLRGRAYWFSGDTDHAADELEALLADPAVKDPWARDVATLARRGAGRHPFEMTGGMVADVEMPRAIDRVPLGSANVVPCELDGERILALVATGSSELLLDASSRREPAWVTLRFDGIEVSDVPALVEDLSPISRQLGVPIKALIGVQFLRHAHVTMDRRGDQFVVRRQDPPPPPDASRVPLYYLRGGGMLLRAALSPGDDTAAVPLLVDSSKPFPLLLQDDSWKRAGVDLKSLISVPDTPNVKRGTVPMFRMGGFDLARMPAIEGAGAGADLDRLTSGPGGIGVDLGGVVGADLLAFFRMTFADSGRFMWIEPDPTLVGAGRAAPPKPPDGAPSHVAPPAPAPIPTRGAS